MAQYYFLATLLPDIKLGEKPELPFVELKRLLPVNLTAKDLAKTRVISRLVDMENLRAFWNHHALDPRGNLGKSEIEEAILARGEDLPSYLVDYLDAHDSLQERVYYFPQLMARFFQNEIASATGFLRQYLVFERNIRLVMVGFRAKLQGRDLLAEMQYEDPTDEIVAQILAQKDARTYEPPDGFEDLKPVFERYAHLPLELQKALIEYKLQRINELTENELFTIDRILAYQVSVILAERWNELDPDEGRKIIDSILKDVS